MITTALEVAMRRADSLPAMPSQGITIDDSHAMMSKAVFDELPDYSRSIPTGTTIGKCWKRQCYEGINGRTAPADIWWLGQFTRNLPVPRCCRYHRCISGVIDDVECHRVRTAEGMVYDPKHPELWNEPPNQQVEIRWRRIVIV